MLARHPRRRAEMRRTLAELAMEMLRRSPFWYTQLTLVHALSLWALPDGDDPKAPAHGAGSQPEAIAEHWLEVAGTRYRSMHGLADDATRQPFVVAAARLASEGISSFRPERYIWIDEAGVVQRVGSQATHGGQLRVAGPAREGPREVLGEHGVQGAPVTGQA